MPQYKCLAPLAMFYMTVKLTTILLIYKIISFGSINSTASSIIIPLWFLTGDIIAEVYGYKIAKQLIWFALIFQFFFAFLCKFVISLSSPTNWIHYNAYHQIFDNLPRVTIASFIAILSGAFINAYAISKWKILLAGKFFWLRSLAASSVGEMVFVILAIVIEFFGLIPLKHILELIAVSFFIKLIINPILVIPSSIIVAIIKKIEKIDDNNINLNSLKLTSS